MSYLYQIDWKQAAILVVLLAVSGGLFSFFWRKFRPLAYAVVVVFTAYVIYQSPIDWEYWRLYFRVQ